MKKHEQGGGHHGHNPVDIFAQMFGGGSQGSQEKRGPEVNVDLEVSLKDLYVGRQLEVLVRKQVLCKQCGGSGAKMLKTCRGATPAAALVSRWSGSRLDPPFSYSYICF